MATFKRALHSVHRCDLYRGCKIADESVNNLIRACSTTLTGCRGTGTAARPHYYTPRCRHYSTSSAKKQLKSPILVSDSVVRFSSSFAHSHGRCSFNSRSFSTEQKHSDGRGDHDTSGLNGQIPSTAIWTIPNIITFSRIASTPLLTYAIATDMKSAALAGCMYAGFTDWLDGYLAKHHNMASIFGAFLDPLADKIVIGSIAAGLALKGLLPFWLAGVIVCRDVALVGTAFYVRFRDKPAGAAFYDPESFTFNIEPSFISKVNTSMQFGCMAATLYVFALNDAASGGGVAVGLVEEASTAIAEVLAPVTAPVAEIAPPAAGDDGGTGSSDAIVDNANKMTAASSFFALDTDLLMSRLGDKEYLVQHALPPMWYATATTTVASGLGYIDGSGMKAMSAAREMKEKAIHLAHQGKERAITMAHRNKNKAVNMAQRNKRKAMELARELKMHAVVTPTDATFEKGRRSNGPGQGATGSPGSDTDDKKR